jgi:hypothetical protein
VLVVLCQIAAIILAISIVFELIFLLKNLKKARCLPRESGTLWYKKSLVLQPVSIVLGSIGGLLFITAIGNLIPGRTIFFYLGFILMCCPFLYQWKRKTF